MKKFWAFLFAAALMLCLSVALAASKPTVSFEAKSGSVNGGFDYQVNIKINKAQSEDITVFLKEATTGEELSVVIPAGKTAASAVIATEPVSATVKLTYTFAESDAYAGSNKHTLSVMPLPNVKFYAAHYQANVGKDVNILVQCKNPGVVVRPNNVFTLKDQFGNVLAEGKWSDASQRRQFTFKATADMTGRNDLTLWLGDYCVTQDSTYLLVVGDEFKRDAVRELSPELPIMAIGIDCGSGSGNTAKILEVLEKHNVKATFFMTGRFVSANPEKVKMIYEAGHEIATHSESHKHMNDMSIQDVYKEITSPIWKIEELLGITPRLYRPPYGEFNVRVCSVVRSEGMEVIRWGPSYHDSTGNYTKQQIMRYATTYYDYKPGMIVLCHLEGDCQPNSLDEGLTRYESLGLKVVPISALLYASGCELPDMPYNREPKVYTNEYWATWIEREMPELLQAAE